MKQQLDVFLRQSPQNKFTTIDQQVKSTNDEMTSKMEELQNKLNELMLSQKQVAATANEADERSISEILKNLEVAYKTNEDIKTLIESNSRTFTSELALLSTKLLQEIEKNLEKSKEISQSNEHRTEEERKQPTEDLNDLEKTIDMQEQNQQLQLILQQEHKEITLQNLESFDSHLQTVLNKLLDACTFLKIAQRASSTEFEQMSWLKQFVFI
ncbi:hypothetical protein RFI_35132 [Reticulomyxa filosa]|uniref:Viral A-type inclusion protein n=1 Tax=Reticulomyxa filosa TaxID=46433 RepID=X6LMD3_RETFI|nr:hypothetical protein RFI_35132 [Reticulomyxa filosa]|eukprot:ETO02307.1 hypothetical protein RFI_35132 [Reticulomyxa filosa]